MEKTLVKSYPVYKKHSEENMRINTITCQHVYNYGATLQAFALQEFLERWGHNVEIIDFRLPSHTRYELFTPYPKGRAYELVCKYPLLRYIITPYKNRRMLKTWGRKRNFDKFDKEYLHLSPRTYRSLQELQQENFDADLLIAGSDQIWNTDMENGNNGAYFLDFGPSSIKRISYAASFGISEIKEDEKKEFVKQQLRKFNSISVREKTGLNILHNLGFEGCQVVDPVFLLSKKDWIESLKLQEKDGDYIFLYDFTHDDHRISKLSKDLAQKERLKILSLNDFSHVPYADIQIDNAGPIEFVQLLSNAKYVISNSFHATAFSIIFDKKFATFPLLTQKNPSRMTDLMNANNMMERFMPSDVGAVCEDMNEDTNYQKYIDESCLFLQRSINSSINK
ncbi:MAG: polysaccharide pyruvyl transferase family protein [Bacteroidaceae bacterium]|nr:polysaccharide pyruvyl transferase family protein [Bacteroidaceae bacterium]